MKTIAVFTSIRSEYGLLTPLLKQLNDHSKFELRLMVGGAHLLDEYGITVNQIREDGFPIHTVFPFLFTDSENDVLHRSLSMLQNQVGKYFNEFPADLLIVLGDRFELIPVVLSALLYNIPIAHISGGEVTEGAVDNQIRHAVTKMSHLHYPATEKYKDNLLRMGEEEWRVVHSGEPGLDLLNDLRIIPKNVILSDLGLTQKDPIMICTFHPETISNNITPELIKNTLERVLQETEFQVLVTASNFDEGGSDLNKVYEELSNAYEKIKFVKSLGQKRYYSILTHATLMLGNSSSGLVEAQSFKLPVVNVGERQMGRLANVNVINTGYKIDEIMEAIKTVNSKSFRCKISSASNIYGDGSACQKIINHLETIDWSKLLLKKNVYG